MPFECKKYHRKCKANCCGVVPLPLSTWNKHKDNALRKVNSLFRIETKHPITGEKEKCVIPLTDDLYCPFLDKNLQCSIYEDRPDTCRKFGDESSHLMSCPMQDKQGNPKQEKECK